MPPILTTPQFRRCTIGPTTRRSCSASVQMLVFGFWCRLQPAFRSGFAGTSRNVLLQSFFDAHFTPVDGKFVKTHTDSALARTVGDFEGKKNALIPELTSVKKKKGRWRSWLRRATLCLREFVSCRELEEELHRSKLYEVFYADLKKRAVDRRTFGRPRQ